MERIRASAELSHEQCSDWELFKTTWDSEMADCFEADWAELLAQYMQTILDELVAGKTRALSEFMHAEAQRVLADVPALRVRGIKRQ